jgi:hypothetical protein
MTLEKIAILSAIEGPAAAPAVAPALLVALASRYPKASALGLARLGGSGGFSRRGMPSVMQPHPLGRKESAESSAGPQA